MRRIVVAVSGASGSIYARKLLESLVREPNLEEIALIVSRNGEAVAAWEGEMERIREIAEISPLVKRYAWDEMFAPPASGSSDYDAMVIVPCSAGCAGRIAGGVSSDLTGRAADVVLKERKPLILVLRESPFSTIHLRNLTMLSEAGAVIVPASPSFYSRPADIEELCASITERILKMLGSDSPRYRWGE